MNHTLSRGRWIPLAVTALLFSLVTLVAPTAAGAQDTPTYTVSIEGKCPATVDDVFTYTLTVTNNGADPIEVVALDQTFTVPAGATRSVEFPDEALGNGLTGSVRVDGEAPATIAVTSPGCIAPLPDYMIEYATTCPGDTGPATVTVTNTGADPIEVTVAGVTFTVEPGAAVTKDVPAGLSAEDFTINGDPAADGVFSEGIAYCDDPPSSGDNPPSSSDDPPSAIDDAAPISAPLSPKFTG